MATKQYQITGEVKWAKVHKPDSKYNKHTIDIKLDAKGKATFEKMGLKNQAKEDEDGNLWVTFRRDPDGMVWNDGAKGTAGAPKVLDAEGHPTTDFIGNGSVATITVSVYDYDNKFGKGKGSRLEKVHVHNLVEYNPNEEKEPF